MHIEKPTLQVSLPAHRKTISTPPLPPLPQKTMSAEKRKRCPHTRKTSLSRCHSTVSTPKKNDLHAPPTALTAKKRCPLKKGKDARTHAKHPYPVATRRSQHRKTISTHPTALTLKKRCPLKKEKDTRHTRKTSLSRCHSTVSTPKKNDLHAPPQSTKCPAAKIHPT